MHPEPEDEYFLGGGDDDDGEPVDDRRTRRGALIGLAVVAVLVAVAITLTSVLVDTSSADTRPRAAAQAWARQIVNGDQAARHRLECAAGTDVGEAVSRLFYGGHYAFTVGTAENRARDRWSVPLTVRTLDGTTIGSTTLTVVRESGRYLVC